MKNKSSILAEYDTPDELSEFLDVSTKTLNRWRAAGVGPPITKLGRSVYYRRESTVAWMRAQERDPHSSLQKAQAEEVQG